MGNIVPNAVLGGGGGGSLNGAKARRSADLVGQNYTAGVAIGWNAEDWDTGAYHDNATNPERMTVTDAGYYIVVGELRLESVASNDNCLLQISRFNSASVLQEVIVRQSAPSFGTIAGLNGSGMAFFNAGDYCTLVCQVATDTSVTLSATSYLEIRHAFSS